MDKSSQNLNAFQVKNNPDNSIIYIGKLINYYSFQLPVMISFNNNSEGSVNSEWYVPISSFHTNDNEPIPVQRGKSTRPAILGNFPVIMVFILVTGIGMSMVFNKKELSSQYSSGVPPARNVVFRTGEGEYRQIILPDGTFVQLGANTIISFYPEK